MADKPGESRPPWREPVESADSTAVGRGPETRRQAVTKLVWITIWMIYLGAPVNDLVHGRHGVVVTTLAGLGLAAFVIVYLAIVFPDNDSRTDRWVYATLLALGGLSVLLSATIGKPWLVLFVYTSVASGAVLPGRQARWAVPGVTAVLGAMGYAVDLPMDVLPALLVPALLGGFAMIGVQQLVRTTRELREARATVAHLAATEERLRLARDLHDLLGHSLSLVTLKSELAGRMLPDRPEAAAEQVADIERVSRQALVDVREAVSGYRRPTLAAELAGARTALDSAKVTPQIPATVEEGHPRLAPAEEGALAWALREAVTNVVRHSGASRCAIALTEADGETVCLTVTDNGKGPDPARGHGRGNGLSGLEERLALAGGHLETAPAVGGGFALRAYVPLRRPQRDPRVWSQSSTA